MVDQQERYCQCCGLILRRKRFKNRLEDRGVFARRKFCGVECARARTDEAKELRIQAALAEKKRIADKQAHPENLTPLEYLLKVMNDPTIDDFRRDKAAIAAARYCHRKATTQEGKKAEKDEAAKKAASGRFAPANAPKIIHFPITTTTTR